MGIKRIKSVNRMEETRKEKMSTSKEVEEIQYREIEKKKEGVNQRRKEKMKMSKEVEEICYREFKKEKKKVLIQ